MSGLNSVMPAGFGTKFKRTFLLVRMMRLTSREAMARRMGMDWARAVAPVEEMAVCCWTQRVASYAPNAVACVLSNAWRDEFLFLVLLFPGSVLGIRCAA